MWTQLNLDVSQEMILFSDGIDFFAEFMEEWVAPIFSTKRTQLVQDTKHKKVPKEL